ncbi:hypothetical protein AMTR_s00008p00254370, partial [Amborella trichopoda]
VGLKWRPCLVRHVITLATVPGEACDNPIGKDVGGFLIDQCVNFVIRFFQLDSFLGRVAAFNIDYSQVCRRRLNLFSGFFAMERVIME